MCNYKYIGQSLVTYELFQVNIDGACVKFKDAFNDFQCTFFSSVFIKENEYSCFPLEKKILKNLSEFYYRI